MFPELNAYLQSDEIHLLKNIYLGRKMKTTTSYIQKIILFIPIFFSQQIFAEPYMAIKTGMKCGGCHVNQTGGGKRTPYGNIYGQTQMASLYEIKNASGHLESSESPEKLWMGKINDYLSLGGNIRSTVKGKSVQNQKNTSEFSLDEALLYIQIDAIPGRLTFYLDERMAPGAAINREAFVLLWDKNQKFYLKAGRMFLPYGFRIEDDASFIRQTTGINYNVWDDGIETGLDAGNWTANLAITNGTAGSAETDQDKQISFRGSYIKPDWRAGYSLNINNSNSGTDRTMQNIFGGFKIGRSSWLIEFDRITDDDPSTGEKEQEIMFLETNLEILKGHNVKITFESLDPDLDVKGDKRTRNSLVWEFVPMQFTQLRVGYRKLEGIPQNDVQNAEELFFQMNNYF